jgi:hypothetical protein
MCTVARPFGNTYSPLADDIAVMLYSGQTAGVSLLIFHRSGRSAAVRIVIIAHLPPGPAQAIDIHHVTDAPMNVK